MITPQKRIDELLALHGTYRAVAKELGSSHSQIYKAHKYQEKPSANLLKLLGLVEVTTYKRIA